MLQRKFGAELRTRFEQEARAATSYEEYSLVSEFYSNLRVNTSGVWSEEEGWRPHPTTLHTTSRSPLG